MTLNVLEIRNYTLAPDRAQHFIDYFEVQMLPLLENEGMHILGQCRVIGQADHFVWFRGCPDMDSRLTSLRNFYDGPLWKKYGKLVNSMLRDSDDVLLLRPLGDLRQLTHGLTAAAIVQQMNDATISPRTGMIAVDIYQAYDGQRDALVEAFSQRVLPLYEGAGVDVRGLLVGEMGHNSFPRHPARQDPNLLVVVTAYASASSGQKQRRSLASEVNEQVAPLLDGAPQTVLLTPTLRSPLRGG
jgi:hypothetical protein